MSLRAQRLLLGINHSDQKQPTHESDAAQNHSHQNRLSLCEAIHAPVLRPHVRSNANVCVEPFQTLSSEGWKSPKWKQLDSTGRFSGLAGMGAIRGLQT